MKTETARTKPYKPLMSILKKHSGRGMGGKVSVRHQGGRHKRFYREIDFKRDKKNMKATVLSIEYDPNRTANIALVEYEDGEKRYILHPHGLSVGDVIMSADETDAKVGNAMMLKYIPLGVDIHNIELYAGQGGKLVRSAGSSALILAKDEKFADVKFNSREVRKIYLTNMATIGRVSNIDHKLEKIGKAGRSRWMGIRPTVRGVAQNPRSHPHGGGEGKSGEGMNPKTPWGKKARGVKTRKSRKFSDKFIVVKRKT